MCLKIWLNQRCYLSGNALNSGCFAMFRRILVFLILVDMIGFMVFFRILLLLFCCQSPLCRNTHRPHVCLIVSSSSIHAYSPHACLHTIEIIALMRAMSGTWTTCINLLLLLMLDMFSWAHSSEEGAPGLYGVVLGFIAILALGS